MNFITNEPAERLCPVDAVRLTLSKHRRAASILLEDAQGALEVQIWVSDPFRNEN